METSEAGGARLRSPSEGLEVRADSILMKDVSDDRSGFASHVLSDAGSLRCSEISKRVCCGSAGASIVREPRVSTSDRKSARLPSEKFPAPSLSQTPIGTIDHGSRTTISRSSSQL